MDKEYTQSVSMACSTCGGRDFSYEDENGPISCVGCGRVFSREEIIHENGASVEIVIDDIKKQILNDASRKINNMLKKNR